MLSKLAQQRAAKFAWFVFSRRAFAPLNKALFRVATAGLGLGVGQESQPDERLFLRRLRKVLPQSPVVIDVGANTGQYAHQLRSSGYGGKIVSFEPVKDAFEFLSENAKHDPNWITIQAALGSQVGRHQLMLAITPR